MASKDKKKAGKKSDVDDGEEPLQAVLLADSFRKRMAPITYTNPKILLPIANVPIIEYTLELLVSAGVKELFIVCCSHADKIQQYVSESESCKQFAVSIIVAPQAKSMGAALREVDSRGKIRGDFILVNGDVVSNIKVEPALIAHKKRREEEKNKDAILTMVFKTCNPRQRVSFFEEEDIALAINPDTKQLVHYQGMNRRGLQIDVHRFEASPHVQARYDLEYAHVSICSPEVLCLFTDEFDWQDLHNDFVPGVMYSEILSYQIYTHTASEGYSGRVVSLHSYGAVTRDIIHRWSYPLVPDVNLFCDTSYEYFHPGVYKEAGVALAQSCSLGEDTVIGSKTSVGERAVIKDSVIGRGCSIGAGTVIEGCFIYPNVTIGPDCTITGSIICEDVNVGSGVKVETNCVLGGGVVISADMTISEGQRVTLAGRPKDDGHDDDDDFGDDDVDNEAKEEEMETDVKVVGPDGKGRLWSPDEDELEAKIAMLVMATNKEISSDEEVNDEEDGDKDDEDGPAMLPFEEEIQDIVRRGVEEGVNPDNIAMEVNGRKFAHDKGFGDCFAQILRTIMYTMPETTSRKEAFASAKKLTTQWKGLLQKFGRSDTDQLLGIEALESFVMDEKWTMHKLMMPILKALYDEDIVGDNAILDWAAEAGKRDAVGKALVAECKQLIEYLEEDDEDDDDDDDDDDEE